MRVDYPSLLQPFPIIKGTWKDIIMNFIEGLPKLEDKDIILVMADKFIKYWHLIVLSHLFTAQDVVKMFMDHLYRFHRLPTTIMTNQDKCLLVFFLKGIIQCQRSNCLWALHIIHKQIGRLKDWINAWKLI